MKIWLQLMNNKLPFYHLIRKSSLENIPSPLLIMVHGYGSNEKDLLECYREGISGYILKPLKYEDYVKKIDSLFKYWKINELRNHK